MMLLPVVFSTVLTGLMVLVNGQGPELTVETTTGTVTGIINGTTPSVRQFRSIPFAQPPINSLRWLPPQTLGTNSSHQIDATSYPPSCPQYRGSRPSVYNQDVTFLIPWSYDQPADAGASLQTSSEDCLYLAVWTPTNATKTSSLPVLFFITGGSFLTNGIYVPGQIPNHWVERTQSHIVVTINYRLNIFGFPNAPGLDSQNVGLLDQRAALEWIHENIAAFGGDPSRIMLWGQSAGAISVDYNAFAFPDDPIAATSFCESGSVFLDITSPDAAQTNFTFMAENFGCGDSSDDAAQVACMRDVSFHDIENFLGQYRENSSAGISQPELLFAPVVDEKLVFSNYTERYAMGAWSGRPAIFSHASNEGTSLVPYPEKPDNESVNVTLANAVTQRAFICPAALSSVLRTQYNETSLTYRYVFNGNFSNNSPRWWMGAYHSSDLALLFGTHQDFIDREGRGSTEVEFQVGEAMQDAVLEFARTRGIVDQNVWGTYEDGVILDFGNGGAVVQSLRVAEIDDICV